MKLGIMQPYFFPYIGYWQLLNYVDKYVVYDDVNYIKGGWINRNFILANGMKSLLTLQLKKASHNKLINKIEIGDNFNKKLKTISQSYSKAPFFDSVFPIIESLFISPKSNLALFLFESIKKISEYLEIKTSIFLSSSLQKDDSLSGQNKIINICQVFGADAYVNAFGGQELYSKDIFLENKIRLDFLKTDDIQYSQFKNKFVPNLSIIDVLMFNSPSRVQEYLSMFELV
jgi:hypothetical protein